MEIGIRALRNGLSEHLDRVRHGETIVVTDRGRAIARIVPTGASTYERLVDKGVIEPPSSRRRSLPKRVRATEPVSPLVREQRR